MEINTHSPQPQTSPVNSLAQQQGPDKQQIQQKTADNSSSTVELSTTSQLLSASTNTNDSSSISKSQAQQAVKQAQQNANDNPTLTFQAQSHKVTSELVANLIG
jgi:hypothetical protein